MARLPRHCCAPVALPALLIGTPAYAVDVALGIGLVQESALTRHVSGTDQSTGGTALGIQSGARLGANTWKTTVTLGMACSPRRAEAQGSGCSAVLGRLGVVHAWQRENLEWASGPWLGAGRFEWTTDHNPASEIVPVTVTIESLAGVMASATLALESSGVAIGVEGAAGLRWTALRDGRVAHDGAAPLWGSCVLQVSRYLPTRLRAPREQPEASSRWSTESHGCSTLSPHDGVGASEAQPSPCT